MFLASTLVETLWEHFKTDAAPIPENSCAAGRSCAVPLRLTEHLPAARTFDLSSVQVHLGCNIGHVVALLQSDIRPLAPIPRIAYGPASVWPVERPPVEAGASPHTAKAIEIFTDGSFDGRTSAWAFHASGDWGKGFRSIGWVGDHVELDKTSPVYLGAQAHGALQGELSALFWCLVWLLPLSTEVPVTILSDCVAAIGITEGLLRDQLAEWHVGVTALQETRAPKNETIQSKSHVRFCAARDEQGFAGAIYASFLCRFMLDYVAIPSHWQVPAGGRIWARFLRYLRELPDLISSLRESSTTLRSLVRRDTQAYLHEVAVQAATDPTNCVVQKLRQLTGGPKRKQRGSTPLPAVETSDGQLAKTHAEAKARWIEHFAAIEDGQVQDPTAFVHACYQRQSDKDLSMHMLTAEDIPSLAELEASLRATSTDRAYGLDDIPGEVIRYGAAEISKSVYALLLKSIFRLTEPVQHKGGTLHCIWKGKGPKQICGSYRGILVSSMLGKSLHKTLRGRCSDTLASSTVPLQVGGLPRFPVTVPAQAARLFQSACHRHGRPYTLLFLDLQEAFYRIIRPLITGDSLSDEQVAHVCSAVQLPAGTMHELHAFLGGAPILSEAGANTWTSGAVSETLHDTWFRLPQEEDVVVTHTGSRPGDSLSDLVFSFLFAKVLTQVRNSLRDAGAIAHIPWCEEMDNNIGPLEAVPDSSLGVSDATWMDDLVMFLTSKAWDAFNKRKKKLFQSPLVSASDKSVFFNSLISTVLFHGAWHFGTMQALARAGIPKANTYLHVTGLSLSDVQCSGSGMSLMEARIRRALSTALQRERWYAPLNLLRLLERTEEIRSLADGLQCQCCLKHFATNIRLCRHLRSRRALLGNLHRVSPLPGIGSRKAPKEHLYCAPTLQAAGPRPLVDGVFIEDELDRPAAEVLDCLAHLDFDGPDQPLDTTVIWERIRQAFSCVCLPARRLRLTARVWLAQLERHSPVGDERPSLHASLLQAAQWVVSADFAAWLAPAPVARTVQVPTLLHSGSRLRLLDFADVTLPEPEAWTADHVLVCIGPWPLQGLEADAVPDPIIYPHTVSLASLAEGKELDFFGDIPPETGKHSLPSDCPVILYVLPFGFGLLAYDLKGLAAALEKSPISVCVNAGVWNDYTGGVLSAAACGPMGAAYQDHCVMAVGFNATAPKPYWIVRNSWASTWGMQGYIYLEMAKNTCGVADDATIPEVKVDLSEEEAKDAAARRAAMFRRASTGSATPATPALGLVPLLSLKIAPAFCVGIAIMRLLRHENMVRCYDVFIEAQYVNVVVDMFPGGDLVDGLNTHRRAFGRVPNAQLARLAKQMMSAVAHVHGLSIIHRDVKGENFLSDRPDIGDPDVKVLILLIPFVGFTQELPLHSDDECAEDRTDCALTALQHRGALTKQKVGCHTTVQGERCFREVTWAREVGIRKHPDWYPDLTRDSSVVDFQLLIHDRMPGKCPIPCGVPLRPKWCEWPPAGSLVAPAEEGGSLTIKVLSYNLFWWNLYGVRRGNGDSAGHLIRAETVEDRLFDVMGFQECENGVRVLEPVGLMDSYEVIQGMHAVCLAYRKGAWSPLASGSEDVGEDMKSHYYGRRGVVWMRLVHNATGRKLLFANHHGPLEVNSGGDCGGDSIANNLIEVLRNSSEPGDAIILVGDFNANSASLTIQTLWSRMVLLYGGGSFGGVDNIFGNMDSDSVLSRKNLGSGGSDHDAISVTVSLGTPPAPPAPEEPRPATDQPEQSNQTNQTVQGNESNATNVTQQPNETVVSEPAATSVVAEPRPEESAALQATEALRANLPGDDWQHFWCGQLEPDVGYVPPLGSWSLVISHRPHIGDDFDVAAPQRCCRLCQREPRCKSWTWKDGGPRRCELYGEAPSEKESVPGFVSGLPALEAVALSDFGTALRIEKGEVVYSRVGTPAFWAPEIYAGGYSLAVDVWAVGVTTFILLTGALPYEGEAAICARSGPKGTTDLAMPYYLSESGADFLRQTMKKEASERPPAREVARHAWLTTKQPKDAPLVEDVHPPQEEVQIASRFSLLSCIFSVIGGLAVYGCSALGHCIGVESARDQSKEEGARYPSKTSKASTAGTGDYLMEVPDKDILEKQATDLTKQISVNLTMHQVSLSSIKQ
ncbi:PEPKR2 [Symbiodinium sp. KB8]|nr:PEPKR2 [Symbiodinium sp. KB8]